MPSQTQIYFDNNTLYTRYEAVGSNAGAGGSLGAGTTISYYGYSVPGAADSSNCFSIKKVYFIGNVQYVDWSNNAPGAFESSWTNRSSYFATPSNITITGVSASKGGSLYDITYTWTSATGSSRYYVSFTQDNSPIYNMLDASSNQYNPYQNTSLKLYVNNNTATLLNCSAGHTYSAAIYAANSVGVSSTVTANVRV